MRKNHWNSTSKKRQAAYKHGYKSGLELSVSEQITEAAYPLNWIREKKYWVPVGRVDNAWGDRNLICTCGSPEEYELLSKE